MSNDLISRQAAIALAKDICVPTKDGTVYKHRCIDPDAIKELPSAERKGRWKIALLDHESFGVRPKVLYCSECHRCFAYPTNYCPNCGTHMVEVE